MKKLRYFETIYKLRHFKTNIKPRHFETCAETTTRIVRGGAAGRRKTIAAEAPPASTSTCSTMTTIPHNFTPEKCF